jgi:predicted metalloprotease with PDZ domain
MDRPYSGESHALSWFRIRSCAYDFCTLKHIALLSFLFLIVGAPVRAQRAQPPATVYQVSFPEPEHHWLQVEATFSGLQSKPLLARMSRSSPGRYAAHEFAKNVFSVEAFDGRNRKLGIARPDVDAWDVSGHDGTVRLVYKIFGDRADGTYLGIDTTHAHINMPATFIWAAGFDDRPIRLTFSVPPASHWKVGTQLYPTSDAFTFTAPNLQYFMDSPTELSDFTLSTFTLPNADGRPAEFRVIAHSDGSQSDVDALAGMIRRLVQEEMAVFGEFPQYEPGNYTFLLDYVQWGAGDGMEHRNSTSISSTGTSLKTPQGRTNALGTIAHEFFHNWNVERIRPAGLEPFDFTKENITCCLWLGEGFTQYYGPLLLRRAGLGQMAPANYALQLLNSPGRLVRSAVQMSEYGPFSDAATSIDPTDANRTFLSYYTEGAAIALALDLSLREKTNGRLSLDDYMRLLWRTFGKPEPAAPGLVAKPYSLKDIRNSLADLTNDRKFADDFFDKYIEGRDVADYAKLLEPMGYALNSTSAAAGWVGQVNIQQGNNGGLAVRGVVPFGTPAYAAGIDSGDVIVSIDGIPATTSGWTALSQKRPGETVALVLQRRNGITETKTLTLQANPALQITDLGTAMTPAQRALRESWLGTKVK